MVSHGASKLLEGLPEPLLDKFVSNVLKLTPSLRVTFLASLGSRVHASAVRVLFNSLSIQDDARPFGTAAHSPDSIMHPLLSNPKRYAPAVKSIIIQEPVIGLDIQQAYNLFPPDSSGESEDENSSMVFRPLDSQNLSWILDACSNLEEFVWESSVPPPDGLCEMLVSSASRLMRVSCTPRSGPGSLAMTKWDGPSLPLLSSLPLNSLHLSRLSQHGARTLSNLLSTMGEYSTLEDMSFDFVFFDDHLCEMIAKAGGKLRRLRIGTSGTKLTDKGVTAIVEGCDALEELVFDEVQGRLSRSLWTKLDAFPPGLKNFRIVISETGPHHSWMKDHLKSLHALPFESLRGLSVVRREPPPRLQNGVPGYAFITDDVVALKPVPKEFLDKMKDAKALTWLECDWWSWDIPDLKLVLENCPNLERIKLCLDAPVSKLLSLTSAFASLPNLHTLSICVNPVHAPGKPPVPVPLLSRSSLPTPRESPVLKSKSVLPQLLDFDQMQTQTCRASDLTGDPSMPLMRDVKRFVRKCPKLALFEWYGKAGRGSWAVSRPSPTTSKISINVSVEYTPPTITEVVWKEMLKERDMDAGGRKVLNIERLGQFWSGETADALAAEQCTVTDKEDMMSPVEKDRPGRFRDGARKARVLSMSTSSSSSGGGESNTYQPTTPTRSLPSQSPSQPVFPPTPSHSETSGSTILSSVVESAEHTQVRERPSIPELSTSQVDGVIRGRPRAATTPAVREGAKQYHERSGPIGRNARGSGGMRSGRGRGRGAFGAGRNVASGENNGVASTSGSGRGKPGRGSNHSSVFGGGDRGKRGTAQPK